MMNEDWALLPEDHCIELKEECDQLRCELEETRKEAKALLERFGEAMDILARYAHAKNIVTPNLAKRFVDEQRSREETALDSLLIAAMKNENRTDRKTPLEVIEYRAGSGLEETAPDGGEEDK